MGDHEETARGWGEASDPVRRATLAQQLLTDAGGTHLGQTLAFCEPLPDGRRVLAVDRFARRTMCWTTRSGQLEVSDRADAFGSAEIDPQSLYDYLFFHMIPAPRTVFRDVRRLPAGHWGLFDGGEMTVRPNGDLEFRADPSPSFDNLKVEFRRLLTQAVRAELGGGVPACFLSGGTDSSTIAGHIKAETGEVHTYSIGFEAEGYDEMAYARIAARHFGARHHEYYVTPDDLVRSIADMAASFDQPFGNSSVLPAYYCARRAREDGVDKLLAGDGGDELFGGNERYATQKLYARWQRLPAALREGLIKPALAVPGAQHLPWLRRGRNYVRDAELGLPDRLHHYNLLLRLGPDQVLEPGFRSLVQADDVFAQQRSVWALARSDHEIDRQLAFDWRYTLAESDLPKVRAATALAGVDVGYPFLDDALVAFSMRLPPEYKVRGMKLRWFFKEALRDFLPEAIITKPKKGFGLPFGVWAVRHAALNALASDSLRSFGTRGVVRPAFVTALLDEHLPAHPGYYGEMVWILMMLEQWLRAHAPDFKLANATA
jgi:asparagine synthase (glutamine-hydrolysing)